MRANAGTAGEQPPDPRAAPREDDAFRLFACSVVHDLNNALSIVLAYGTSLVATTRPGDPIREDLVEIVRAAERASTLAREVMAVSRRRSEQAQAQILDLNDAVAAVARTLPRVLGPAIALRVYPSPQPARVFADERQLERVLLNLAVNARDAMPDGGVLVIETGHRAPDPGPGGDPGSENGWVTLAVSDTGSGIEEGLRSRIFDPFFTTKKPEQGSGLGLAIVRDIVQGWGGTIDVESAPGQGTTFEIRLAAVAPPAPAAYASDITSLVERGDRTRSELRRACS